MSLRACVGVGVGVHRGVCVWVRGVGWGVGWGVGVWVGVGV